MMKRRKKIKAVSGEEERLYLAAIKYLLLNHGHLLVPTAHREIRIKGIPVWILTVTLRYPTRRAVQHLICRYVAMLGLDPAVTVHSFRVTALTTARERGCDIIDLQDFAGHADPRTTLIYYAQPAVMLSRFRKCLPVSA